MERSKEDIENDLVYELPHYPCLCVDGSQPSVTKPAIDSFLDILGEYHLYFSWDMALAHGHKIGMIDRDEAAAKDAMIADLTKRLTAAETELAGVMPRLSAMVSAAQKYGDTEADDEPVRKKAA